MPKPCHPTEFLIIFCRMVKKTNRAAVGAAGRELGLWDALWSCLLHRLLVLKSVPVPFGGEQGVPPRLLAA